MSRSARKYTVELRIRDNDGGAAMGTVHRFLYRDDSGQDWIKISGEWSPVDNRLEDVHAFVHDLPRDMFNIQDVDFQEAA